MAQKQHRWFAALGVLAVLAVLALVAYWPQVALYWALGTSPEDRARLFVVPVPLKADEVSQDTGTNISFRGISMETSWGSLESERKLDSVFLAHFERGRFVMVFDPDQAVNPLTVMRQQAANREEDLRQAFGEETLQSPYDFYRVMLNLTPDNLTPFMSFRRARGTLVLLTLKNLEVAREESNSIFELTGKGYRGFQFGDPERDHVVRLLLFDNTHRIYEVWIGRKQEEAGVVTQAHINRILATLTVSDRLGLDERAP